MTALPPQPQHALSADDILAGLDPDQRAVATELDGPMRVLAGAGTGKTRAITHRIAYGIAIRALPGPASACPDLHPARGRRDAHPPSAARRLRRASAHLPLGGATPAHLLLATGRGWHLPSIVQNKAALITEAANRLRISTDRSLLRDLASVIEWAKVQLLTPDTLMQRLEREAATLGDYPAEYATHLPSLRRPQGRT